jgi:hypothetical protein
MSCFPPWVAAQPWHHLGPTEAYRSSYHHFRRPPSSHHLRTADERHILHRRVFPVHLCPTHVAQQVRHIPAIPSVTTNIRLGHRWLTAACSKRPRRTRARAIPLWARPGVVPDWSSPSRRPSHVAVLSQAGLGYCVARIGPPINEAKQADLAYES